MQESSEERLIRALAGAIVQYPRANLQELAAAVGVSKATLYRFARTRENIVKKVRDYCVELTHQILENADLQRNDPHDGLRRLIHGFMEHRELINFLLYHAQDETGATEKIWHKHQELLDAFFLRGQKMGAFRIDVSAVYLNEFFSSVISGFAAAERRGRVARLGLQDAIEALMLRGVISASQDQIQPEES